MNIWIGLVLCCATRSAALEGPANVLVPLGQETIMTCRSDAVEAPCGNLTWYYNSDPLGWRELAKHGIVAPKFRNFISIANDTDGSCDLRIKAGLLLAGYYKCGDDQTDASFTAALGTWEPLRGDVIVAYGITTIYCTAVFSGPWRPIIKGHGQGSQRGFMTCSYQHAAMIKIGFVVTEPLLITCNMSFDEAVWPDGLDAKNKPMAPDSYLELPVEAQTFASSTLPAALPSAAALESITTAPNPNAPMPLEAPPIRMMPIAVTPILLGVVLLVCVTGLYCKSTRKYKRIGFGTSPPYVSLV